MTARSADVGGNQNCDVTVPIKNPPDADLWLLWPRAAASSDWLCLPPGLDEVMSYLPLLHQHLDPPSSSSSSPSTNADTQPLLHRCARQSRAMRALCARHARARGCGSSPRNTPERNEMFARTWRERETSDERRVKKNMRQNVARSAASRFFATTRKNVNEI